MKRDLKLNMSHLDAISRKVQSYIDAMEAVELAARKFEQTIKDQDSDAYNKLSEQWETNVWENEKILKYRLGVIKEMIDSYISDMTDYIAPENETAMMRVDRNDIWWNYKQIEGEATSFDWIVQDTGSTLATYKRLFIPNPFSSDEENEAKKSAQQQEEDAESARRQRNYEKLQGFRDQLDTSIREKISDSVDEIRKIYENKVIPFENTDDSYKSKMSAYYSEWSSMGDKFSDAGNAIRDFLAGIGDSLVDTVKGLLTLVVDLGLLYVHSECSRMTLGHVPETLDQEVEKIKQKYEPLLKDPVNTIGGIGQSICDTADEKGVAYSSGYIVTEVVTALLADKGLDKIKNVAKTGKTADNVADIAEGAAKGAGNAAEDAGKAGKGLEEAAKGAESAAEDAGKAGKTAGKVGESGSSSNKFSNWDDMKDAYKGKVTKFLKGNKPKGSPIPKNWFEKGGTLEIETLDDGSQIWKYTSAKGDTVPYINQQVKFPKQYMFPDEDIAEFSIGKFTGDRELDKKAALEFLRSEGYDEIPDGYVLHHDYENGKMQLIEEEIHRIFTHYGGNYYNK